MGEEATAETVLGRRQRRQGWRLVNDLYFSGHGDVDHLLVGPGGIFVLESKWTNTPWELTPQGIVGPPGRDPITQARDGSRKVESMLRHSRQRFDVTVHPLVVIWGKGSPRIEGGWTEIGGVWIFEGRQAKQWRNQLRRDDLSHSLVDSVAQALEADLASRIDRPARRTESIS
jgi:hypothetical protein